MSGEVSDIDNFLRTRNGLLIHRFYHEMWNRFDKSILPELLTEDVRFRGSLGQNKTGYGELSDYVEFIQQVFPDFSNEIEEIISEGDKAFARLTYRGTHSADLFGIAPTGRTIQYAGAAVFRFRGDRIAEIWVLGDIWNLVSQLKDPTPDV
ncbi:MAG: ester cyclase [Candidatus Binataceae bacterium]|nr:ester cyclase [Candidatus Binataceae bacterium]